MAVLTEYPCPFEKGQEFLLDQDVFAHFAAFAKTLTIRQESISAQKQYAYAMGHTIQKMVDLATPEGEGFPTPQYHKFDRLAKSSLGWVEQEIKARLQRHGSWSTTFTMSDNEYNHGLAEYAAGRSLQIITFKATDNHVRKSIVTYLGAVRFSDLVEMDLFKDSHFGAPAGSAPSVLFRQKDSLLR